MRGGVLHFHALELGLGLDVSSAGLLGKRLHQLSLKLELEFQHSLRENGKKDAKNVEMKIT